ncbi:hypothetical protein BCR34DRAFT_597462 [Clohesyomyces aquaticus]|uniref:Uncharacterized protein n=1 Tax=Clohesyomyces aquaticus TaxID=1231657 RepID=A0A1Y2A2M6_9PLEO|nr:hypothetical protein BCR34DRAFT_597462 [Clohesyomyces aquaticus]
MPLPQRQKVPKGRAPKSEQSVITDPRFANFQTDPLFRLPSKKHTKVKLDSRFSRLLTDKDFYTKASVDRYGRKLEKNAGKKDLEKFYRMDQDDDDDDDDEEGDEDDDGDKAKKDRDNKVRRQLAKVEMKGKNYDPIRDGGLSSSSSDESSSDDEGEEEEDVEDQAELVEPGEVPTGEVTARLAAVNMDWDNMRASDIMAVANSFIPADGRILSVVIYPSEFGQERMQREELEGPPREVFATSSEKNKNNLRSIDEESPEPENSEDEEEAIKKDLLKESTGEDFDSKALRAYQLDRLRYYYAVITCSSPTVAKALYDSLDGREYLSSANFFDLRFVPDEVTFDEDPHDECEKLPDSYKPNEFTTDALTHSKVKLTWDAEDTTRKEAQKRAFSRKEIDENDLKAYIGTDSSSSEDEADDAGKKDKAAALRAALGLPSADEPRSSKPKPKNDKRDRDFKKPDGEMVVTFSAALSSKGQNGSVFENEPPVEESTVEKYVRQQKERKAKRKERAKAIQEGRDPDAIDSQTSKPAEPAVKEAEDPWNDPFFGEDAEDSRPTKSQVKKSKKEKQREEREKAEADAATKRTELELLMVDDEDDRMRHFDMNEIEKAEKAKKKKGKKSKYSKTDGAAPVDDRFKIDTQDPRFAKLYESHEFAIDPTNPRFKETQAMKALLEEGRKKRKYHRDDADAGEPRREKKKKQKGASSGELDDLKKLAARVKAKSKKL